MTTTTMVICSQEMRLQQQLIFKVLIRQCMCKKKKKLYQHAGLSAFFTAVSEVIFGTGQIHVSQHLLALLKQGSL